MPNKEQKRMASFSALLFLLVVLFNNCQVAYCDVLDCSEIGSESLRNQDGDLKVLISELNREFSSFQETVMVTTKTTTLKTIRRIVVAAYSQQKNCNEFSENEVREHAFKFMKSELSTFSVGISTGWPPSGKISEITPNPEIQVFPTASDGNGRIPPLTISFAVRHFERHCLVFWGVSVECFSSGPPGSECPLDLPEPAWKGFKIQIVDPKTKGSPDRWATLNELLHAFLKDWVIATSERSAQ